MGWVLSRWWRAKYQVIIGNKVVRYSYSQRSSGHEGSTVWPFQQYQNNKFKTFAENDNSS